MSISSELLTLNNTKTAIRTAINNKGGSVGANDTFASYATAIDNLPSGGSGNPLLTSIDVSDFTGTTFNRAASYITDVTIPSSVTSIANYAFQYFSGLSSITIPSSVTSIGSNAFNNCGITSINIPSGVTSIGTSAFQECRQLTSITIPNTVTSIPQSMCWFCSGLTSVTIPDTVTSMDADAFRQCTSLTSVTLSNSLTSIGSRAFQQDAAITSITIPSSVTSIGSNAFNSCSGLTSVTVLTPSNHGSWTPPTLGSGAFDYTNGCPIYVDDYYVLDLKTAWSAYADRIQAIPE